MLGNKFCGICGTQLNWGQQMPEIEGFLLLLLRPSLLKIFDTSTDNSPIDADVIRAGTGLLMTKGMTKYALERLTITCVSEFGSAGYTLPMRLDLLICLERLASSSRPRIDFPVGLFTNRDVMIITKGLYSVQLFRTPTKKAKKTLDNVGILVDTFPAPQIVYSCTTVDEGTMTNLRRLEATANHLLASTDPTVTIFPKLPHDIAGGWQHGFLEPIFQRARMGEQSK
jgi:hypothetical protein